MKRLILALSTVAILAPSFSAQDAPDGRRVTLKFGHQEPEPFNTHRWLFSPEVVADKDGSVRLARSVLISDEIGASDHHQAVPLSDRAWAKKEFCLLPIRRFPWPDWNEARSAQLLVYGKPKKIRVNGTRVEDAKPLPSTGWSHSIIPAELLRNAKVPWVDVEMGEGGQLLFEQRPQPGHSYQSRDGGVTWYHQSTVTGQQDAFGEYLVRLRLGRHAHQGWAISPAIDLWQRAAGEIPRPGSIAGLQYAAPADPGRRGPGNFVIFMRRGATPSPDEKHWTDWQPLSPRAPQAPEHRWIQLKFLMNTLKPDYSPSIPATFQLSYDIVDQPQPGNSNLRVTEQPGGPRRLTSLPFIYQKPSPRLKLLREQYQLDKVIAPGKDELEQLVLLRHWVRNQWHTAWGTHPAAWMPPWDTLQIFACKDQPDCLTMCTHYGCVFTQCCLALGWNARHCILDHHCVAEVWVDQHQKWVMMDAGNSPTRPDCNLHFERAGVPLSALELHNAYREKKTDGIIARFTPKQLMEAVAPLCRKPPVAHAPGSPRPASVPVAELKNFPVCGLENYRRYAFPGRNNYLESLLPGELYQGWAEYFYDGYWWVGDDRDDPQLSPEYSKHLPPSRPQDIDWDLNWVRIHLARTAKADELRVDLETFTPNLERLEMSQEGKEPWKATAASFVWKLNAGKNTLRARSVNAWGRAGKEARVEIEWHK